MTRTTTFLAALALLVAVSSIFVSTTCAGQENAGYEITNLTYKPGQFEIAAIVGTTFGKKLRVRVTKDGNPVAGEKVYFFFTETPGKSKGAALEHDVVITDAEGVASTGVTVGDKEGMYLVTAFEASPMGAHVEFAINAHTTMWLFFIVMYLLGGLALFLFGMFQMSEAMQKFGGHRFEQFIDHRPYFGLVPGRDARRHPQRHRL